MKRQDAFVALALVLTTLVWGSAFTAIKVIVRVLDPVDLAIVRFVLAGVAFAALLLVFRHRGVRIALSRRETGLILVLGSFGVVGYHVALNVGEEMLVGTSSEDAAALLSGFLIATNTLFTVLLVAAVGQERLGPRRVVGVLVGLAGTAVLVLWGRGVLVDATSLRGALVVLLAPLSWAVYSVVAKRMVRVRDPLVVTSWAIIAGTLLLLPFARPALVADIQGLTMGHWAWILVLSLGATVGGYLAWGWALRAWEASRVSTFVYLVPLFGVLVATLVEHERFTVQMAIGGGLILGGLYLANAKPRVAPQPAPNSTT